MNTNRLAEFFNRQREIIEAAETPFAKLAVFILPILSPSVPALLTGLHIYKLLLGIFESVVYADYISSGMSVIVSIVLEMLGYVGAISCIQSLFQWVRKRENRYILPFLLNGFAYLFYLAAMWLINYQLGIYFGTPEIVNNIVGLLAFVTVPTSLLAANHLSQKEEKEEDRERRAEQRSYNLERLKIKVGANGTNERIYEQSTNTNVRTNAKRPRTNGSTNERTNNLRTFVERSLEDYVRTNRSVPGVSELARTVARTANATNGIPDSDEGYERYKGYCSEVRKKWLENHPEIR